MSEIDADFGEADLQGTPFHRWLGLRWSFERDDGWVDVDLDLRPDLCGPAGSLEGGIVSTIIDVAGATAASAATGRLVATMSMSMTFLAPGRDGPIRASGIALRVGRHEVVSEVRVVDLGRDSRLMNVALCTFKILEGTTVPGLSDEPDEPAR